MKLISTIVVLLLTSCQAFEKNEPQIKQVAHDTVDEIIDDAAKDIEKK